MINYTSKYTCDDSDLLNLPYVNYISIFKTFHKEF